MPPWLHPITRHTSRLTTHHQQQQQTVARSSQRRYPHVVILHHVPSSCGVCPQLFSSFCDKYTYIHRRVQPRASKTQGSKQHYCNLWDDVYTPHAHMLSSPHSIHSSTSHSSLLCRQLLTSNWHAGHGACRSWCMQVMVHAAGSCNDNGGPSTCGTGPGKSPSSCLCNILEMSPETILG